MRAGHRHTDSGSRRLFRPAAPGPVLLRGVRRSRSAAATDDAVHRPAQPVGALCRHGRGGAAHRRRRGHTVGRKDSPRASYDELVGWTKRYFPGAEPTHYWSAQDYVAVDELPYVGPLLPGSDHFFVATGFAKWGMTNGVAAALLLAKRILGGEPARWGSAFDSWSPHELTGLTTALKTNLEVGWHMAAGWVTPITRRDGQIREGAGSVSGPPWHMAARSVVDGVERCVSPVCTHLGGVLAWNDAEKSWDCPLHGSRFGPDGAVLGGTGQPQPVAVSAVGGRLTGPRPGTSTTWGLTVFRTSTARGWISVVSGRHVHFTDHGHQSRQGRPRGRAAEIGLQRFHSGGPTSSNHSAHEGVRREEERG